MGYGYGHVIDMARGLLMLRPAMGMAMDMALDMGMDMDMVMVIDMVRGLLMLRLAMVMVMDMAMEAMDMDTAADTVMDTAMDTAMDTDTMDKRTNQNKFHIEYNTKSSMRIS